MVSHVGKNLCNHYRTILSIKLSYVIKFIDQNCKCIFISINTMSNNQPM